MRRVSCSLFALLSLAVVLGMCLPHRSEVRRSAVLPASPQAIHELLTALPQSPAWCSWEPALRPVGPESLVTTATLESRGVWFDVPSRRGVRKAALLIEPVPEGTRVEWLDVLHLRLNPFGTLWALTRERRVGAQMEESLEALRQLIADQPPATPPTDER